MFFEELTKITGLPYNETYSDYKIVNVGGKYLQVQNYKKLLVYNDKNIVLKVKNNEINIEGNDLVILELAPNDVFIKGNINLIYMAKSEGNNAQ